MPDAKQIWKPGGSLWHNQDAVREHGKISNVLKLCTLVCGLKVAMCRT